jgi:hypothetical protein
MERISYNFDENGNRKAMIISLEELEKVSLEELENIQDTISVLLSAKMPSKSLGEFLKEGKKKKTYALRSSTKA